MSGDREKVRVGIVSLGCPKALVDSEAIASVLGQDDFITVEGRDEVDVVVVNTCGFIDPAIDESLAEIEAALATNEHVVVTGCLGAKGNIVADHFPQVSAITGPHAPDAVAAAVRSIGASADGVQRVEPKDLIATAPTTSMLRLTPSHYAYLKISEGCNHHCTFCVIPDLRGRLVSKTPDAIAREAEMLVERGVKELLVVSQDTSAYGVDLRRERRDATADIVSLSARLGAIAPWVRLHYVYPYPHVDRLIPLMADGVLLPYLDMPLQHAAPAILKAMRRPAATAAVLDRLARWRELVPDLTIRSTFIVGFPGETDEDVDELIEFLAAAEIDRLGCFTYSDVAGAQANGLPDHVSEAEKLDRQDEVLGVQQGISEARLQRFVGRTGPVIIDQTDGRSALARSTADAPEIDGVVHLDNAVGVARGDIVDVRFVASDTHDLFARIEQKDAPID